MDATVQLIQSVVQLAKNPVTWYIFAALFAYWVFSAAVGAMEMPPPAPKEGPDPYGHQRFWFRFLNRLAANLNRAAKAAHIPGSADDDQPPQPPAAGAAAAALILALALVPMFAGRAEAQANIRVGTVTVDQIKATGNGPVDTSLATHTLVIKIGTNAAKPATCTVGELYIANDLTPAGQWLYVCTATNTWTRDLNVQTANTWTALQTYSAGITGTGGDFDFSAGASVRIKTGTGVPAAGNCNTAAHVGRIYIRSDANAVNSSFYVCSQTAAAPTFAWELAQPAAVVISFNGRSGVVTPASGDYTAAQVTNAFDKSTSNTVAAGTQDLTGAAHTLPIKTGTVAGKPATCTVGEYYFATDATAGVNQFYCTATNTWTQQTSGATPTDVQIFTGNGTWTKPAGAKSTTVIMIGGGGGGGSGRRGLTSTNRFGGSGGGGGAASRMQWSSAILGATETVTVGAAGTGGAAQTVDSTDGNDGVNGGDSSFGNWLRATGGVKGLKGAAASAPVGGAGGSTGTLGAGGAGGTTSSGSGASPGGTGNFGVFSPGTGDATFVAANAGWGGGGGGGSATLNSSNVQSGAAAGGTGAPPHNTTIAAGTSGGTTVAGGNGGAAAANEAVGGGGGGGGSANGAANDAGGNGGIYGGGGGGGGPALNGANSGKGGDGAIGIVIVITTF